VVLALAPLLAPPLLLQASRSAEWVRVRAWVSDPLLATPHARPPPSAAPLATAATVWAP